MVSPACPRVGVLVLLAAKLAIVFCSALGVVFALCILLVRHVREHDAALGLPASKLDSLSVRSFSSLEQLQHSHQNFIHVFNVHFPLALACYTCVYVLKQVENNVITFALPGSALLNVFAGAVLPLSISFALVCILTARGSSCCYLLSKGLASEDIFMSLSERVVPGELRALRVKIEDARARGKLIYLLLFLILFPFTPIWFLNVASPWLQVPLKLFAPSVALGLLPYNLLTVHAGSMLSSLRSTRDLMEPRSMGLLVLLAGGMLIPSLLKKKLTGGELNMRGN
ncbi:hypothetical protein PsorP6_000719 [Peronosclerospora sorghi]|uniref:Uncharacterized protein n=1 Tax=Peronosclerospora sorghi TaxID=230839 RepID=A0ACC0WW93_9STRA|nr:hypothetical protein PsorP6_000719 [Peronosclerospora sorghi]